MELADDLGILRLGFLYIDDVLLGNDQHVRGRLRLEVLKDKGLAIFEDLLARDFTTDNAAEKAIHKFSLIALKRLRLLV